MFGAGASFGSDTSVTPPLGADLFDHLQRFNPDGWGTITGDLASSFREDFEEAIKRVNPAALGPLQRAMAAYFFEFRPRTSNVYVSLARRIAQTRWDGAACTLNYERLLEISLLAGGVQPVVGQATEPGRTLELCLPHGCCHIFCDAARGAAGAVTFDAFAVSTNGPVTVVADPVQHRHRILVDAFPPVMSYFEPQKRTTAGASFIDGQRARWKHIALAAEWIVVIGVKVRRHDDHMWGPLAATEARIVYCGGPEGVSEYRSWVTSVGRRQNDLVLVGYFRDEFERICFEAGL